MQRGPLIPPLLKDLVYQAVTGVSGVQFSDAVPCPDCSTLPVSHDLKRRRFSTVHAEGGHEHIYVYVKRFHCRSCNQLCYARAPFYEKSRFGSPIIDLCLTLTQGDSFSHAANLMNSFGIVIDRGTIRNTVQTYDHPVESIDLHGLLLPQSIFTLSTLITNIENGRDLSAQDVLNACGFYIDLS